MLRILILFLIAANCFINAAYAENVPRLPSGDFSELRRTGMVNVKAVIDPQTIQLEDGHIVRLTGIDFPDFNPDEPGDFSLTAMQILRDAGQAGMSKSEFTRRTQFMDHRSRDGVLRTLAEAGLIETVMLQNKGRPSQWIKVL